MKKLVIGLVTFAATFVWAQIPEGESFMAPSRPSGMSPVPVTTPTTSVRVADLNQEMASNKKDIQDLALRVDQLERDKTALEEKLNKSTSADAMATFVTKDELKIAETRMNEALANESKRVQLAILEDLKAAKKSVAVAPAKKAAATETVTTPVPAMAKTPTIQVTESEKASYMKEGIKYTVQPGDTLSSIAKKNHSSVRAIMVANEISSPNKLWVGKELFVPTL